MYITAALRRLRQKDGQELEAKLIDTLHQEKARSQVWWLMLIISAFNKLRQEDCCELKANLSYYLRPCHREGFCRRERDQETGRQVCRKRYQDKTEACLPNSE